MGSLWNIDKGIALSLLTVIGGDRASEAGKRIHQDDAQFGTSDFWLCGIFGRSFHRGTQLPPRSQKWPFINPCLLPEWLPNHGRVRDSGSVCQAENDMCGGPWNT